MMARLRLLVAALWAGSLWTVGYLVAPTLFATLSDRVLAGTIASSMFARQSWLSMICAGAMLVLLQLAPELDAKRRRTLNVTVIAILAGTLIVHFGLQPVMAALRESAGAGGVMASGARDQFGILHGVSSVVYLAQSLLAGFLIVKNEPAARWLHR